VNAAELRARCDWQAVRADVAEHRAECEMAISQTTAEIRAACRPPRLREQEQLASLQRTIDTQTAFLQMLDREGL
jgi:hypothetical protein